MSTPNEPSWNLNGIDAATGRPLFAAPSLEEMLRITGASTGDAQSLTELREWWERARERPFDVIHGVDPRRLDQTGWGVVFPSGSNRAIRAALAPLLDMRRAQADSTDRLYRELSYQPGESKLEFLARHGVGPGPVDPEKLPYYLLIVAEPEEISFEFQYQLDIQYAVGRLHFDSIEAYAHYARTVVAAEMGQLLRPRKVSFFGVSNLDDRATQRSLEHLVRPLAESLDRRTAGAWCIERTVADRATKEALRQRIGGSEAPALLFSASHGLGFDPDDPDLEQFQGALLCQDWPGSRVWKGAIPPEHYFSGADVADESPPAGLIAFLFACYGAGTPRYDGYLADRSQRKTIAPRNFLAHLPRRLLGHSQGGALAVVGHVERAWTYSFDWPRAGEQTQVFESMLGRLLDGYPLGAAMEYFGQRYAELTTELVALQEDFSYGESPDLLDLFGLWTATNDARSYVVLGDPAVRLAVDQREDVRAAALL